MKAVNFLIGVIGILSIVFYLVLPDRYTPNTNMFMYGVLLVCISLIMHVVLRGRNAS